MPSFKDIKDLANNPMTGVVTTVLKPTPAGIAYTGANIVSKAVTGKTIPQHLVGSIRGPATTRSTAVGPNKKGKKIGEGGHRDAQQKYILRSAKSHGGLVSHKSISACESSMRGKK